MKNTLKYAQCYDYMLDYIRKNRYKKDDRLPTGKEIADTLGVSRITVQRALTELQEAGIIYRIQGSGTFLAKDIDEEPSEGMMIIPMVVSHDGASTRSFEMIQGAEAFFSEHNGYLTVHNSHNSAEQEVEIVNRLLTDSFRSLLVFPVSDKANGAYYYQLIRDGVNLAFLDHAPGGISCNLAKSDNVNGGLLAVEHLISRGHQRIAAVCPADMLSHPAFQERFLGYRFALRQHELEGRKEYAVLCAAREEIPDAVERLFSSLQPPTAVFALDDLSAAQTADEVRRLGYRVPEDVAVIGFGDEEELCVAQPKALSSVAQDFFEIGYAAAFLLYHAMRSAKRGACEYRVPVRVVARASTNGRAAVPAAVK